MSATDTTMTAIVVLLLSAWTYRHARNTAYWRATAEKLGRDHGIAVRADLTSRVGDHLRWRWLTSLPLLLATSLLLVALGGRAGGTGPFNADYLFVAVTFAASELCFATGCGAWSLTHDGRPVLAGLWLLIMIADLRFGWRALQRVLDRPSNARDDLELGWDDVLRHIDARGVTGTVVWAPAFVAFLLVSHRWLADGDLLPFYAAVLAAFVISRVFRRGRTTWTRQWNGGPPTA